jgi:hypothetical protein
MDFSKAFGGGFRVAQVRQSTSFGLCVSHSGGDMGFHCLPEMGFNLLRDSFFGGE